MHHIFIVNPAAGKGKSRGIVNSIEERFFNFPQPYEILLTNAPNHAKELAVQAIEKTNKNLRIYSVGGDGTLNEVINGIAESGVDVGIIPCGSGNDTSRMLYPVADPLKLITVLPLSSSIPFDLGKVNDRYFVNIASIGFDAEVVIQSRRFTTSFPGTIAYLVGILTALSKLKKYKISISIDDKEFVDMEILLSLFANGNFYGGGFKAAPLAKMDDGILDFYLVDPIARRRILKFLPRFRNGKHGTMSEVNLIKGSKAFIKSKSPLPVNIDGEVLFASSLSVELLPKSIKFIVP